MAFDTTGEIQWQIPPGYYEKIAQSDVNSVAHWSGRMAIAPIVIPLFGRPIITWSPGFQLARPQFEEGNIIAASVHRSELETVIKPATFERMGLHHARPVSKLDPLFQNPAMRWGMHRLGAFAVDKRPENTSMADLVKAASGILQRRGIVDYYFEGTRITEDPLLVKASKIKAGGIIAAVTNNSLVVPSALAGLTKVKAGEGDARRTIAQDKRSWFGVRRPLVVAYDDPFRFEPPDFDPDRLITDRNSLSRPQFDENADYLRAQAKIVSNSMQRALDRAYKLRGSSLDVQTEEYKELLRTVVGSEQGLQP